MPNIFDGFLTQLTTGDSIKDYKHASRLFVDNNYALSPKYNWLFHVYFDLNPEIAKVNPQEQTEVGMLVKSVDLPRFRVDTKNYNNYNRPSLVQTKIRYEDINIVFHDDSANVIRRMWYDYYNYYYRDMDNSYADATGALNEVYKKNNKQVVGQRTLYNKFGYSPRKDSSYPQYIQAIRIYSLHQKRFSEYTLLNPIISGYRHGSHQNGQDGILENTMTIQYESVLYAGGVASVARGFADLHYDKSPSPLSVAGGGTNTIFGPGGIVNAFNEVITDGTGNKWGSAAFKAIRGFQKNKNVDFINLAQGELVQSFQNILRSGETTGVPDIRAGLNSTYFPYKGVNADEASAVGVPLLTSTKAAAGSVGSNGFSLTAAAAAVTGGIASALQGSPIAKAGSAISGVVSDIGGKITGADPNKILSLDKSETGELTAEKSDPIPTNSFTSAIQTANGRLKTLASQDAARTAQEASGSLNARIAQSLPSTVTWQTGTESLASAAGNALSTTPFKNFQIPASIRVASDAAAAGLSSDYSGLSSIGKTSTNAAGSGSVSGGYGNFTQSGGFTI
jgi:hypothetical protein